MANEKNAVLGSWIVATGTTLSAIGATPSRVLNESQLKSLDLWGNVLQATGNALTADSEENYTLDKVGNEIQAIGNTTIVASILLYFDKKTKIELNIKGNFLQALGGGVAFTEALGREPTLDELLIVNGNLLQAIGNSLQAISGIRELRGEEANKLNEVGSWIQAIGSILCALGGVTVTPRFLSITTKYQAKS
ncbi:DUF6944 family repetitive protein [Metabacillus litoralis]|uniref:DUF6944 family repetitive protein n=1 Tax=Metabacillus litoralis TaxID=152268 RepID=UPI001CFD9020|nr:hypothetical protein [Metabacillus litoralis]